MEPQDAVIDTTAAPAEAPAPAPAPAEAPAPAPAEAPAPAPAAPASSLEAAVLGLEATGLAKLDQPLPEDQVVRIGQPPTDKTDPLASPGTVNGAAAAAPGTGPVASTPKPGEEPPPAPDDADLPEPTEAELAAAPKGLRRRFQQVRAQNQRLKETVASVQPDAQQYAKLQTFMATNELDARSAANALRIAALVQGAINGRVDPTSAVQELTHWADQIKGLTGEHLPTDVQKRLDDGLIDEDTAKEIAQSRAQQVRDQRRTELDQQQLVTRASQAQAGLIYSAIQAWEQSVRTRDPDYSRKAKLVETTAKSLRLERYGNGLPPSVGEAQALAQEAYDIVTREMAAALPPQSSVRAPLNGATSSKSTMRTEPKTSLEAAMQGLERMATS
jgi:hypothetical protein